MFSDTDIAAAIAYNNAEKPNFGTHNAFVFPFIDITKNGAIRFDVRHCHITALNEIMERKLLTEADFAQFKKQVKAAIKQTATT